MSQYEAYDGITLHEIVKVMLKRKKTIILSFLVIVLLASAFAFFTTPKYKLTATISLGNYSSITYTQPLGAREVLLSDSLLMDVIKQLNLDVQPNEYRYFKEKISVDVIKDTSFVLISIQQNDRELGRKIINKMIENYVSVSQKDYDNHLKLISDQLFTINEQIKLKDDQLKIVKTIIDDLEQDQKINSTQKEIRRNDLYEYMREADNKRIELLDRQLALQKEKNSIEHVKVVNPVRIPQYPVFPNKPLVLAIGSILGIILGLFAGFIHEYFKRYPIR